MGNYLLFFVLGLSLWNTEIVNKLSKRILAGDIDKSHPVLVDVFDGVVVFRNEIPELEKAGKKK